MKDSEQKISNYQNNVENWTLQRCKEYLMDHPNGLKAESVRKRMNSLNAEVSNVSNHKGTQHVPEVEKSSKIKEYLIKILLTIIVITVSILLFGHNWYVDGLLSVGIVGLLIIIWKYE